MIKSILFDFGGVIADEGYRDGLYEIARKNKLAPEAFYALADALIAETGYLTGIAGESVYWDAARKRTGISGTDRELRKPVLTNFRIRSRMIECVDLLRERGFMVALLSDQTNWLDEINEKENIFTHFDRVLNSYETHRSKRDASTFPFVCGLLNVPPGSTLFIDDNPGHIERAAAAGMNTILFTDQTDCIKKIRDWTLNDVGTKQQQHNKAGDP